MLADCVPGRRDRAVAYCVGTRPVQTNAKASRPAAGPGATAPRGRGEPRAPGTGARHAGFAGSSCTAASTAQPSTASRSLCAESVRRPAERGTIAATWRRLAAARRRVARLLRRCRAPRSSAATRQPCAWLTAAGGPLPGTAPWLPEPGTPPGHGGLFEGAKSFGPEEAGPPDASLFDSGIDLPRDRRRSAAFSETVSE